MEEKKLVPKLRFPGFTEPWEQRKLSDILVERNEQQVETSEYPLMSFVQGIGVTPKGERYDRSFLVLDQSKKYKRTELGDFIYSSNNLETGSIGINKTGKAVISPVYSIFYGVSIGDSEFIGIMSLLPGFIAKMIRFRKGVVYGQWRIHEKDFLDISVSIPSVDERTKITKLILSIEELITLHQRKLEHLKLKKKSLLQKLFPKEGEVYPELRFPGFTDPWEQRKLGSIGSTYTGLSGKTKEDFGHGEAQYITYLNVFQNTVSDITMTDKVEIDTTQNEVKYGDVLFTTSSETPEEVGMSSVWLGHTSNIYLNSFCFGFRPNQKIDPYFLGYSLRAPYMRDKIKILAQGISRYNISKNKVMELEISLPNNEEQSLLGNFLRNIDLGITLHQRKLEHLQLLKKALLQQLFV